MLHWFRRRKEQQQQRPMSRLGHVEQTHDPLAEEIARVLGRSAGRVVGLEALGFRERVDPPEMKPKRPWRGKAGGFFDPD